MPKRSNKDNILNNYLKTYTKNARWVRSKLIRQWDKKFIHHQYLHFSILLECACRVTGSCRSITLTSADQMQAPCPRAGQSCRLASHSHEVRDRYICKQWNQWKQIKFSKKAAFISLYTTDSQLPGKLVTLLNYYIWQVSPGHWNMHVV